ncbi:MAG: 4Fe-4S binding protein [Dehalococcoidia bacterium]|nr:4Fe-4S binding protein [Dehalococcoidia bacterium]MDP6782195.1 4Fe-4S binding protein [Dehalococcoidia bacterium]
MSAEDIYELLAQRHECGCSSRYKRVLSELMTPLQARIVAELPSPPEEIASRLGMGEAGVLQELDQLFQRGIVNTRDITGRQGYRFWNSTGLLWTYTMAEGDLKGSRDQMVGIWDEFIKEEWYGKLAKEYSEHPQPFDRVVPALRALKGHPDLLACEDIGELMRAQELIATHPCACRLQAQLCQTHLDTCFLFGWAAEYSLSRGMAQRLTPQEAVEVVDRAADHSQVHIWMNSSFMQSRYMCNCCSCCCIMIRPPLEHGVPLQKRISPSRFEAELSGVERCLSCLDKPCLKACSFDAIDSQPAPGGEEVVAVDPEKCWGCGFCVLKCPHDSLRLRLVRPKQHIPGAAPLV